MNKKKNKYHAIIDSDFLFDRNKVFKSRYTPWIYVYLKLEYQYYIQKSPFKAYSLKTGDIARFFQIDRATVHRSLNELQEQGLVKRKERDSYIVYAEKKKYDDENYLMVPKNLFIDIFTNGGTINEAAVYYYMVIKNRHYVFDSDYRESNLSQTMISRDLNFDSRKTKTILNNLLELGLITKDDKTHRYKTRYSKEGAFQLNRVINNGQQPIILPYENNQKERISRMSTNKIDNVIQKRADVPIYATI